MKQIIKDALILFCITAIAGVLLAFVNEITKGPIAEKELEKKQEACREVFIEASSFVEVPVDNTSGLYQGWSTQYPSNEVSALYEAYDASGNLIGYVLTVTNKEGYSGNITFSMGITLDRTLNGIAILETSETVGLGLEAENVLVPQFAGKNVVSFVYTKTGATAENEIDAISSATITTNAFVNGVNAGLGYFDMFLGGGVNE